jgi:hypothetical protein
MSPKKFKLGADQIKRLVNEMGACIATDMITVEGSKVGYMYREAPFDKADSGWRFFSGTEDQDYIDNADNSTIYNVNTIANYDPSIIPYLELPCGTELERESGTERFYIIAG